MSKALIEVKWPPEQNLPPADAETGQPQLHYVGADGRLAGGYSCVGLTGKHDRCVVQVDASPTTLAELRLNPKLYGDCCWLVDVASDEKVPAVALATAEVKAALVRCGVEYWEYAGAGGRGHIAANKASWEEDKE